MILDYNSINMICIVFLPSADYQNDSMSLCIYHKPVLVLSTATIISFEHTELKLNQEGEYKKLYVPLNKVYTITDLREAELSFSLPS